MRGTILDYTPTEAYILLDDDSIITVPISSVNTSMALGSKIDMTTLSNGQYSIHSKPITIYDKIVDFF